MSKRPYNPRDEIAPLLYALLSIHAVGRDNAKNARFFANELKKRGYTINHLDAVRQVLRDHPRAGILDGNIKGGYYLITTADEARQTITALTQRINKLQARADALKNYFNIKD